MKRITPLLMMLLTMVACTISFPSSSFDKDVQTGVAVAFTQTAMAAAQPTQAQTASPASATVAASPTLTQTPPADDPKTQLGSPDWKDDLSSDKNWSLDQVNAGIGEDVFTHSSGRLDAQNSFSFNWILTYLHFRDAYLEAKFDVDTCSKNDQYGLMVRAKDYVDGIAYYYMVTCDGHYNLLKDTAGGNTQLLESPTSDVLNKGSGQTNTLGIWVKGSIIRLYANNHFLKEVSDSSIDADGHFGMFVNSAQTPGFTVHMDEIAYWLLK